MSDRVTCLSCGRVGSAGLRPFPGVPLRRVSKCVAGEVSGVFDHGTGDRPTPDIKDPSFSRIEISVTPGLDCSLGSRVLGVVTRIESVCPTT